MIFFKSAIKRVQYSVSVWGHLSVNGFDNFVKFWIMDDQNYNKY